MFVVAGKYSEPNVYDIKSVDGKGPVHTVNQWQLQDLKMAQEDIGSMILIPLNVDCKYLYLCQARE